MKNLFILLILLLLTSCEAFVPEYKLSKEEQEWIIYNTGDTVVFTDTTNRNPLYFVADKKEEMRDAHGGFSTKLKSRYYYNTTGLKSLDTTRKINGITIYYGKADGVFGISISVRLYLNTSFNPYTDNNKDTILYGKQYNHVFIKDNRNLSRNFYDVKRVIYQKEQGVIL